MMREDRRVALSLACASNSSTDTDEIIERARKFFDFLTGDRVTRMIKAETEMKMAAQEHGRDGWNTG